MSEDNHLQEIALGTERRFTILETEMTVVKSDLVEIKGMLVELTANMNKMKGFWAGVVAAGTALGAALGALMSYIFQAKVG